MYVTFFFIENFFLDHCQGERKVVYFKNLVAKWLHWGKIHVNVATNKPYYHPIFNAIVGAEPEIKAPSAYALMNMLLANVRKDLRVCITCAMAKWVDYGYTVMLDSWTAPTH